MQETLPAKWISTTAMLEILGDLLYHHRAPANGILMLSPPAATRGSMVNCMVVADTQAAAREIGRQAMTRLRSSV